MKIINWLRRLRFNHFLIKIAKVLSLHRFVKRLYYKFILSADDKIKVRLFGYEAQFYTRDIEDVSFVETFLIDDGNGEIRVIQKLLQELRAGDIAYDIGASIGTHSIFMALKAGNRGRVLAFEPEPRSFEELKANIALNKLNHITPFRVALSDCRGRSNIRGGLGSFTLAEKNDFVSAGEVEIVKGYSFIQENNLPLPNVVKIDVEGYEWNVIKGLEFALSDKNCRMVACEIHLALLPDGINASNVIELLDSYGYERKEIFERMTELHGFFYKN